MFKSFSEILKQFTTGQRVFVLVLLLMFSSGSYVITNYLKTDDCRPLIEENLKLQDDFIKISQLIREREMRKHFSEAHMESGDGLMSTTSYDTIYVIRDEPSLDDDVVLEEILDIATQHCDDESNISN